MASYKLNVFTGNLDLVGAASGGGSGITELIGDVTAGPGSGVQAATVVSVGGSTAAAVNTAAVAVGNATALASSNTLALRDASANIAFGTVTAALAGDVLFASTIGTVPVATVLGAVTTVGNATAAALSNTLVLRDGFANFAAGTITATLNGLANNVSGVVAIANGGSGQSNQQAAINNLTNIGAATNGDVFQYLAGNAQFAPYTAPGTTGTPNTPAYYDNGGLLTSIPGRSIDNTTYAQSINLTSTADVANFTIDNIQYSLALANTSDNITLQYNSLDITGTLTDTARLYQGSMTGEATTVRPFAIDTTINSTGDFSLANLTSTGSVGGNFQGIFLASYGPITGGANFLTISNSQTVTGQLAFSNWGNNSAANNLRYLDWNNSGNMANDLSGLNLSNSGVITKGLNFLNLYVNGDVGDGTGTNINGLNLNIDAAATVQGSIFGLYLNNGAVFTGAANQVQAASLTNTATGDSVRAFSVYNSADLDEEFSGLRVTNDTADSRTSTGVDITISGNATDDAQGLRINVSNQTSTNNRVRSLDASGATFSYNNVYRPASSLFVDTGNNNFTEFRVASGSPLTGTDSFTNSNIVAYLVEDDIAIGPVSLGQAHSSFISLVGIADTKTVDLLRGIIVAASIQDPGYADAGTVTEYQGIVYAGALASGGASTVGTAIGLIMPTGFDGYATNNWGIRVQGATADNYVNKLAIGTTSETAASGLLLDVNGQIGVTDIGSGLSIAEGSNAKMGTATLVAGTVTVNTTAITANSRIFLTIQAASGSIGNQYISNIVASTSFDIVSTDTADTSTIAWMIVEAI